MAKSLFKIGDEVFIRDDWDRFVSETYLSDVIGRRLTVVAFPVKPGAVIVEYHIGGKPYTRMLTEKILGKRLPDDATIPW